MKKAMITIEVLVAMLILFLVITSSFENIKFFNIMSKKKENYEDIYIAVLNIKAKYENIICKTSLKEEGILNGFNYILTCNKEKELNNYVKRIDLTDVSGNIGNYVMRLYKVSINLQKANNKQVFSYYIVRGNKISYE